MIQITLCVNGSEKEIKDFCEELRVLLPGVAVVDYTATLHALSPYDWNLIVFWKDFVEPWTVQNMRAVLGGALRLLQQESE